MELVTQSANSVPVNYDCEDFWNVSSPCFVVCTPVICDGGLLLVLVGVFTFSISEVFSGDDDNVSFIPRRIEQRSERVEGAKLVLLVL